MTHLYRLYGEEDQLLYVGVAEILDRRLAQHAKEKQWWPLVKRTKSVAYPSRLVAMEEELRAIRSECPVYNIVGRGSDGVRTPRMNRRKIPAMSPRPGEERAFFFWLCNYVTALDLVDARIDNMMIGRDVYGLHLGPAATWGGHPLLDKHLGASASASVRLTRVIEDYPELEPYREFILTHQYDRIHACDECE